MSEIMLPVQVYCMSCMCCHLYKLQELHIAQLRSKLLHILELCSAMVGGLKQTNICDFQLKCNISRCRCAISPLITEISFQGFCKMKFSLTNDQIRPPLCSRPTFGLNHSHCSNSAISPTERASLPPYLISNRSSCLCPCLITCFCICKSQ